MTTDRLLEMVAERGLAVTLGADGLLVLSGPGEGKTPALLNMLKAYRDAILARLRDGWEPPEPKPEEDPPGEEEPRAEADDGEDYVPPWFVEYLFCEGSRRSYRMGSRPVPGTAWFERICGNPSAPWERTIYCPAHVEGPGELTRKEGER